MIRPFQVASLAATCALCAAAGALGWADLPKGQDIALRAGTTYAVLASVSTDFSSADILAKAPAGVEVQDFVDKGPGLAADPNPDHRYVSAKLVVHKDSGILPWKSPWPTTIFSLVSASCTCEAGLPCPVTPGRRVWPWIAGSLCAFGILAFGCFWWVRPQKALAAR